MNNCIAYWESQDIDPLDAMMTVGCRSLEANSGVDVVGGFYILCSVDCGLCDRQAAWAEL